MLDRSNFSERARKENAMKLHEVENRDIAIEKSKGKELEL